MSDDPITKNDLVRRDFSNPIIQIVPLLVFLVLFSWFILKPKINQFRQGRANLKATQDQLNKSQTTQKNLDDLVAKLHSSKSDVALVDEALPLNGRASKTYYLFDSLVKNSGMSSALIGVSDTDSIISAGDKATLQNPYDSGRKLHTITINSSITGTMEQLRNFLQLIETNGRVLDVDTLDIIGGDPITKFRITVKAYAYEKPLVDTSTAK